MQFASAVKYGLYTCTARGLEDKLSDILEVFLSPSDLLMILQTKLLSGPNVYATVAIISAAAAASDTAVSVPKSCTSYIWMV